MVLLHPQTGPTPPTPRRRGSRSLSLRVSTPQDWSYKIVALDVFDNSVGYQDPFCQIRIHYIFHGSGSKNEPSLPNPFTHPSHLIFPPNTLTTASSPLLPHLLSLTSPASSLIPHPYIRPLLPYPASLTPPPPSHTPSPSSLTLQLDHC